METVMVYMFINMEILISLSIIRRFHGVYLGRTFIIDIVERRRVRSRLIFCWFLRRAGKPGRARDECGRSGVTGVWSASRAGGTRGDGASGPRPNGARPVAEPAIFFPLGRHRVPLPRSSPSPPAQLADASLTFRSPRTSPGVRPRAAPRRVVFVSRGPRASRRAARRESRRSRG